MQKAKQAGLAIGIYVYNYCSSRTRVNEGCNWVINKLEPYKSWLSLPVFIDMEDISITGLNKQELTGIARNFCVNLQKQGLITGVYANKYWFQNKLDIAKLQEFKIWVAQYADIEKPSVDFKIDLWQYTSKGKVAGITGYVDKNKCFACQSTENNITDITGEKKEEFEMKKYKNGKTKEIIYQDTACKKEIGYLYPHEECDCYGIIDNLALVVYQSTVGKKTGFAKWLGGIK